MTNLNPHLNGIDVKVQHTSLLKIISTSMYVVALLVTNCLATLPCLAAENMDHFANITPGMQRSKSIEQPNFNWALPSQPRSSKAMLWFEKYDNLVYSKILTDEEALTLKKPINRDAERFQKWDKTAKLAAARFLLVAKKIRLLSLPAGLEGIKEYRDEKADWYEDMALVYDDLTRPREPAKTFEELQSALEELKRRADGVAEVGKQLKQMDENLRSKYDVHQPRQTDMLFQAVNKMDQGSMRSIKH